MKYLSENGKILGERKDEMKSPFVKQQERDRMRKSEYFDEKLSGCKISQKRNCEVGVLTNDENAFNKN